MKFISSFKIQKLLNRQKRGDRLPNRKANVELSNTQENQVKKDLVDHLKPSQL